MRTHNNLSAATRRALRAYGERICLYAFSLNEQGEGAHSIALSYIPRFNERVQAADAAINAGRELITGTR